MNRGRAWLLVALAAGRPAVSAAGAGVWWDRAETGFTGSAYCVVVDPSGPIYAGGSYRSGTGTTIPFLRKYSPYGGPVWTVTMAGAGSTTWEDAVRGVALYPVSGTTYDVIAVGAVWNGATPGQDGFVARLTPYGTTAWAVPLNPSGTGSDGANAVAVTPAGDIIVAGWQAGTGGVADVYVQRVTGTGTAAKGDATTFPVPEFAGVDDRALAVAIDRSGSIYVGGYVTTAGEGTDAWVAQYPATGSLGLGPLWTVTLEGAGSSTDFIGGLAVDPAGGLYAVGGETGALGWLDILLARITLGGAVVWTLTIDGGEGDSDEADACTVEPGGDLLVAGSIDRPTDTFSDLWVARLGSDGAIRWEFDRNGPGYYIDGGRGIAMTPSGGICVAGFESDLIAGLPHPWLVDLRESSPAPAASPGSPAPHAVPNPFRPGRGGSFDAAGITFRPVPAGARVRIYTLAGALVIELRDEDSDGLIAWNARNSSGKDVSSGVYLFVVDAGTGSPSRGKVVIIR